MREVFQGIFQQDKEFFTRNLVPGHKLFKEKLVKFSGAEYRNWSPFHSKLCAGIAKGLKEFPFTLGSKVLYLGAGQGYTVSFLSDIVGKEGAVFAIEFGERNMHWLYSVAEQRFNIVPILEDASNPANYKDLLSDFKVDVLFQDVSQKQQSEIFVKNSQSFLSPSSPALISLKTSSIDSSKKPELVLEEEKLKLEKEFNILQVISLEPFEKNHFLLYCKKK